MSSSDSTSGTTGKCPVFFCGTPQGLTGFSTFLSNAQKLSAIEAVPVAAVSQTFERTKAVDYGIIILLVENKNDLVGVLNVLVALKKRLSQGALRVLAYSGLDNDRVSSVLKSKGCAETFVDGLSQKALVHKLQKHLQIVGSKAKTLKKAATAAEAAKVKSAAKKNSDRLSSENAKIRFVPALDDPNDCWLLKNKRDFKFIRGNWMGEMIGPGPSIGSWAEAGGTTKQPIYRWTPRVQHETDPFVPGKGSWFFSGRKPEFDWKINRWRFVSETPSLFYRAANTPAGSGAVFRFVSAGPGSIDICLNSTAAKAKLKAIIATFDDQKLIKEDKKKPQTGDDLALEKEKKARGADYEGDLKPAEDEDDLDDLEIEDEEGKEWGALKKSKDKQSEWEDRSDEGEDEADPDWTGLDVGRGNKFNGGRGVGQGDGGDKGYKHDDEEEEEAGDSEEESEHDWTGLNVGRGNKFNSGRGMGQGDGGDKGYKHDKDAKGSPKGDADEEEDAEDDDGLEFEDDLDLSVSPKANERSGKTATKKKADPAVAVDARQKQLDAGADLDEILGSPEEDPEWDTGADAFEKITLDITISRPDSPNSPSLGDVSLLERRGSDLLLDAPTKSFTAGERVSFAVVLGQSKSKRKLQLNGTLMTMEPSGEGRDIILVNVTDISKPHLAEIQNVFDQRQAQLLKFLREAKG